MPLLEMGHGEGHDTREQWQGGQLRLLSPRGHQAPQQPIWFLSTAYDAREALNTLSNCPHIRSTFAHMPNRL